MMRFNINHIKISFGQPTYHIFSLGRQLGFYFIFFLYFFIILISRPHNFSCLEIWHNQMGWLWFCMPSHLVHEFSLCYHVIVIVWISIMLNESIFCLVIAVACSFSQLFLYITWMGIWLTIICVKMNSLA